MRKHIIITAIALLTFGAASYAQGRSISRKPKITTPYITEQGDTLKVGTVLQVLDATGDNNQFKYVQLLNKLNEPIQPATTKVSLKKQPVLFFKEEDDITYAFTEFFCINVEMALMKQEIRIVKGK